MQPMLMLTSRWTTDIIIDFHLAEFSDNILTITSFTSGFLSVVSYHGLQKTCVQVKGEALTTRIWQ